MASKAQTEAKKRYAKRCKQLNVVFYPTEKEMTDFLWGKEDKTGYIKYLIAHDMAKKNS